MINSVQQVVGNHRCIVSILSNIVLCNNQNYVIIVTIIIVCVVIIFGNWDSYVDNNKYVETVSY